MDKSGKIIICPTPIGNLGDISQRLIDVLNTCDYVYAEDTRVTSKLLSSINVNKKVNRLDENLMSENAINLINLAKDGCIIAYCSDAGMPGVSDPGLRLVSLARQNNVAVEVLPGPCAAINAYVASGFNKNNFYFVGFLPKKTSAKQNYLKELCSIDAAIIIYESPNRLLITLHDISEVFGNCKVAVCRELTKLHEEVFVGAIDDAVSEFESRETIKGELVIVIESNPSKRFRDFDPDIDKTINFLISKNMKTGDIAKTISLAFGINKNQAYDYLLSYK